LTILHDAAGIVGNAAIVAHGELDAPPGNADAVLRNVELERPRELPADGVEAGAGQRNAYTHLENVVSGGSRPGAKADGGAAGQSLQQGPAQHRFPQF
jgi:hypothetical protein